MQRAGFAIGAALIAVGFALPHLRRALIADIVTYDAEPSEPAQLPAGDGPGLTPSARTRVLLIDGLAADVAATLPAWTKTCARGIAVTVDVGFPTVSLPVEVALWTGLTPPLDRMREAAEDALDGARPRR